MKLKSYFAATVEAAMNQARVELGPDAMLVSTKRTSEQGLAPGAYEVVFAATTYPDAQDTTVASQTHSLSKKAPPLEKLSEEVASLKSEMERLASAITRSTAAAGTIACNRNLAEPFSKLLAAEFDSAIAQELIAAIASQTGHTNNRKPAGAKRLIAAELDRLLKTESLIPVSSEQNAIALVGPPGVGKTTTLVKLAVQYGLKTRRPCQILSMDTHRVAGFEPLRSYAAIAGLSFQTIETPRSLVQALEEHRSKEIVFIDTPGYSRSEFEEAGILASISSRHPGIETHLVLSASMKPADMNRLAHQYEVFAPSKLIFTRLDETETFGPLLNLSIRLGKPVSFLTRGPQIPEDLEPAGRQTLIDLALKEMRIETEELASTAVA